MGTLFEFDYGENNEPIDDIEITQVILYFGKDDAAKFKKLCKEGMKVEWPKTFIEDGNISVLLLKITEEKYGHLIPQKTIEPAASGEAEGQLFGSEQFRQTDNE